ncbi:hypothetical protein N0V84_005591 [Fusarium piperis]|uniref:Uncharacterized protein n=1 Tax=Fusarium piperis TaxID=1435070 RepID=A0A9W8WDF6_9HYPO|nr:hypothetical protein N0V84_005591 [Fusarium piperis]
MVSEYGPLIPPELRRPPFVPRLHADELLARERIFNWRIMSKHMPYENYIRRAHDLAPWEMFLEFMAIDVVDQLTGRDGIKNWYLHPVPDFEDPQIQPLHGRWVRAFTFSEHVARSNEIQLTGDWLVRAEVRSYSYETLLNFDVRRHAVLQAFKG